MDDEKKHGEEEDNPLLDEVPEGEEMEADASAKDEDPVEKELRFQRMLVKDWDNRNLPSPQVCGFLQSSP